MLRNGGKLPVQPVVHDLRQRIAVHFFCPFPGYGGKLLLRPIDEGRKHTRRNRADLFHHICNFIGILHNHFVSLFLAQISKLLEHFGGGTVIKGRLLVGVGKALSGHQDFPVIAVMGIHKMNVAGSDHRFVQFLSQLDDGAVKLSKLLLCLNGAVPEHEHIIAQGLNLQIVVKLRNADQLIPGLAGNDGPEQLSRFAGGADQKALPVLHQHTFRDSRLLIEIIQMSIGNQFIQIFQSCGIFHQNNLVIGTQFFYIAASQSRIDLGDLTDLIILLKPLEQHQENISKNHRVVAGPVMVKGRKLQMLGHRIQLVVFNPRQHGPAHRHRIQIGIGKIQIVPCRYRLDKGGIERSIMSQQHRLLPAKLQKSLYRFLFLGSVDHHTVVDPGQLRDFRRNGTFRIDKGVEYIGNLAIVDPHRADFRNPVVGGAETGSLQVKGNIIPVKGHFAFTLDHRHHIVDKISLCTVNYFYFPALAADRVDRVHGVGKRLGHTVVRDGNSLMAPGIGPVD